MVKGKAACDPLFTYLTLPAACLAITSHAVPLHGEYRGEGRERLVQGVQNNCEAGGAGLNRRASPAILHARNLREGARGWHKLRDPHAVQELGGGERCRRDAFPKSQRKLRRPLLLFFLLLLLLLLQPPYNRFPPPPLPHAPGASLQQAPHPADPRLHCLVGYGR